MSNIIQPQPGPQIDFIRTGDEVDVVWYGGGAGGGKTWAILVDNLRYQSTLDSSYFSAFFRNTTTELDTNLWPEALRMYRPYLEYQSGPLKGKWIGDARIKDKTHEIIFPSGAKSRFAFLELDKHADSWYGAELSRAYFDESQKLSDYAFNIIMSRLRSKSAIRSCFRGTLNPDPSTHIYKWVLPFLDDEGFPIKEFSGRIRYFLMVAGTFYSDWDRDKLLLQFPDKNPQTYTYIPSSLEDNKILTEMEPGYRDKLDAMPPNKRKQLLLGCWAPNDEEGLLFQRNWLRKISKADLPECTWVRAYDLASTPETENNKFPDWSWGTLVGRCSQGFYYIADANRMRERPGARNQKIIAQAGKDQSTYGDVTVVTAVDPGAAGKSAFEEFAKVISNAGYRCKKDPIPTNKSKKVKYEPCSDMMENGLVYICEDTFEDPEVLEDFYRQNELFDGVTRSTNHRKDDAADSLAMAINSLSKRSPVPSFTLPSINAPTRKAAASLLY